MRGEVIRMVRKRWRGVAPYFYTVWPLLCIIPHLARSSRDADSVCRSFSTQEPKATECVSLLPTNDERLLLRRTAAVLWTRRELPPVATPHISTVASTTPASARSQISNSRSIMPMTCRNFREMPSEYV